MLLAIARAGTVSLQMAVHTEQILFFYALLSLKLLLAVYHAAKVRNLTVEALIESAGVHGKVE